MLQITDLIKSINKDADANRLFWVAGIARETWPVLMPHLDELHSVARLAVEHYAKDDLLNAISDLVTENDKYGGCPCSSPAWGTARTAIAKTTTLP